MASDPQGNGSGLQVDPRARRLTKAERAQFAEWGFVKNLPVFSEAAVPRLQAEFRNLAALLPHGVGINETGSWHKANRWFYDLCCTPAILDYVEGLLGPDFCLWGGRFFVKYPGDGSIVPWHQDAQYWPLNPKRSITVWLAIYDADDGNGAMQVVRGSHRAGVLPHHAAEGDDNVLEQEVDINRIDPREIVTIDLRAGEMSLHDEGLLHGSGPNTSDRLRCGATMRYCATEVKGDLAVWPTFEVTLARGIDRYQHNPIARVPEKNGFPGGRFQHSSEFA